MEQYSERFTQQLCTFLRHWMKENKGNETLILNALTLTIRNDQHEQEIPLTELIREEKTLLNRCKQDLQNPGPDDFPLPDYLAQDDEQRLETLLHLTQQTAFRKRKTRHRLETFYYLGEVLNTRGWQRKDKQRIRTLFTTNKGANDLKNTARRVYELFRARGLPNLYAVTHIRPYHLQKLSEEEFYNELIPEAQRLRSEENDQFLELTFAGAHA